MIEHLFIEHLFYGIGGIGLFLLGMVLLTDGLKDLAGNALRRLLVRFTSSPARGALTGALTTAIVQSSSITTLTAVGFVGAGLMTFPQGLGIIFGANIGTTITGWMVALVGFKLEFGLAALALLPAGVLMRLLAEGRLRAAGWALTGFCLIFLGIEFMQQGLGHFQDVLTPSFFPPDTLWGRFQLLLLGIAITMLTQSSSAGVATALVALHAGTIELAQAAAMVIGMDIGTTFKTALATIGASTATRRTGWAHVIYNLATGVLAFVLLGPFLAAAAWWQDGSPDAELTLVAFHTFFNTLGVLLVLPVAGQFARLVERLVPERDGDLTRRLDPRLLSDAPAAVDAAAAAADGIARALVRMLTAMLSPAGRRARPRIEPVMGAIAATRNYLDAIRSTPHHPDTHARHQAVIHALDHLSRLARRISEFERIETLQGEHRLRRLGCVLRRLALAWLEGPNDPRNEARLDRFRRFLRAEREAYRARMVAAVARREIDVETGLARMDAIRWLHRVTYHLCRLVHHLAVAIETRPTNPASAASGHHDTAAEQAGSPATKT